MDTSRLLMQAQPLSLVAAWYMSSVVAILTAKLTLKAVHVPYLLCLLQLAVATALQLLYLAWLPSASGKPCVLGKDRKLVFLIALVYSLGFAFTNLALASSAPAAVETLKSAEPVATVVLALLLLGERERLLTYVSLGPTVIGTAMAAFGGDELSLTAVVVTMASNVAFAGRAILVKTLKRDHPSSTCARSDIQLFYHVSRMGALLLLPLGLFDLYSSWAVLRAQIGERCARSMLFTNGSNASRRLNKEDNQCQRAFGQLDFKPFDTRGIDHPFRQLSAYWWTVTFDCHDGSPFIVGAILTNSVAHASYNQLSFQVLSRVATSTHAMLNIFRRLCLIVVTVLILNTPMDAYNWVGAGLAVGGVAMFARERGRGQSTGPFNSFLSQTQRDSSLNMVVVQGKSY